MACYVTGGRTGGANERLRVSHASGAGRGVPASERVGESEGRSPSEGQVWRDHGALEYRECVLDDNNVKFGVPFPRAAKSKSKETAVFSWIVFKSRAHRDRVNAKVMKDPRLAKMMDPKAMPFDVKRMAYGGFKVIVDL